MNIILVDRRNAEVRKAKKCTNIEGRFIRTAHFALPSAKDNRTWFVTDFLPKSCIVYLLLTKGWYFK